MRNRDSEYLTRAKRVYGLSAPDYYALYRHQHGRCALCGVHEDVLPERLCVDHCHATKVVRGLLCRACNAGVGSAEKHGTNAFASYLAWPPAKELAYQREHPDAPHPV